MRRYNRNSRYTYLVAQIAQLNDDPSVPWNYYPCLEWPFARDKSGYGRLYRDGTMHLVHRMSAKLANPTFDVTLHALHRCDNPPCFRPVHLFAGTNKDNVRDAIKKGYFHGGSPQLGSENGNSKLTEQNVVEIKRLIAIGMPVPRIAELFEITRGNVRFIRDGHIWKGV